MMEEIDECQAKMTLIKSMLRGFERNEPEPRDHYNIWFGLGLVVDDLITITQNTRDNAENIGIIVRKTTMG